MKGVEEVFVGTLVGFLRKEDKEKLLESRRVGFKNVGQGNFVDVGHANVSVKRETTSTHNVSISTVTKNLYLEATCRKVFRHTRGTVSVDKMRGKGYLCVPI